jgi:hypothetical protein
MSPTPPKTTPARPPAGAASVIRVRLLAAVVALAAGVAALVIAILLVRSALG